tara:strand:- start:286 stop:507 length:222 start_codon:yes stop_codon:yes gene_type:complete
MFINDWRYSEDKLKLREQALKVLLSKFGGQMKNSTPKYTNKSIYECAQDWVSQGNVSTSGIVKYYEAYYAKSN